MHRPVYNVIISNVPGPPMPLYLHGAKLIAFYPHGPVFEGAGLNITVMSYQDSVDIGVIACRDSVHDVGQITESFTAAIARLLAAAERETAATENRPRGTRQRRSRASPYRVTSLLHHDAGSLSWPPGRILRRCMTSRPSGSWCAAAPKRPPTRRCSSTRPSAR